MTDETQDPKPPSFPYRDPCGVCGEDGIEILCWGCRERLHGRCCKVHYDHQCPVPNGRNKNPGRTPLEVVAAVEDRRSRLHPDVIDSGNSAGGPGGDNKERP